VAGKDGKSKDNKEEKVVEEKTEKKSDKKEKDQSEKSNPKIDEIDHRKLPSVVHVKGAYKLMKGQIKTTMLMSKPYILKSEANGATFPEKHDAIRSMKLQIKGAINGERAIVETDDDDDYASDDWLTRPRPRLHERWLLLKLPQKHKHLQPSPQP